MIITPQIRYSVLGFNGIWVLIHFVYFVIYYSRYSDYFHKLDRLDRLEKMEFYETSAIDLQREKIRNKIKKLQRISFFPTLGIFLLHLITFYFYWESEIFVEYWLSAIYILIGALVFVFLANKTQGARVLRGKSPRWPR